MNYKKDCVKIKLKEEQNMKAIGLMSGTSLDGVDASLVNIENEKFTLIKFVTLPYEEDFKKKSKELKDSLKFRHTLNRLKDLKKLREQLLQKDMNFTETDLLFLKIINRYL